MAQVRIDDYVRDRDKFIRDYVEDGNAGKRKGLIVQRYKRLKASQEAAKGRELAASGTYSNLRMTI